ncbi:FitA-like ribbon-helix-helix domain-containing protein [Halovibrio sp. HP20-50]|uniref:FitA-like ribbon-helix-helix domain-containing protein n=1 Tax=Halovibrio sp. HP20-59 TaxID=3080275 RepID=UPI00294ADB1C|nr:plasmid stabilization protein [Halovibrio sp. HP20-59]MEA2117165.1 plasmid stabilization protein [Halovibrio sp. HP20-59]
MATITVRNLDDELKALLRVQAASHGHSMEEEVRLILRKALVKPQQGGLGRRIHQRFAVEGGLELALPTCEEEPRDVDFAR